MSLQLAALGVHRHTLMIRKVCSMYRMNVSSKNVVIRWYCRKGLKINSTLRSRFGNFLCVGLSVDPNKLTGLSPSHTRESRPQMARVIQCVTKSAEIVGFRRELFIGDSASLLIHHQWRRFQYFLRPPNPRLESVPEILATKIAKFPMILLELIFVFSAHRLKLCVLIHNNKSSGLL